jgi:chromosome segregation ATPase
MVRLQEEQGISCPEALDANRELLKQKERLESELAILKDKVKQEQNKHSEATKIYQQLVSKINAAKNELQAIQSDTKAEVVLISSIQEKAEKERRRIEKELERCKKNAGITAEEIAVAAKLKTEVEKSGFNLETMLGLVQEFVPYQDARERLAGVLKNSQSLTEHISTLEQRSAEKKKDIAAAIDRLVSQQNSEQSNVNQLKELHRQLENSVARLQADLDGEQGLRQFYIRYRPLSDLL